MIWFDFIIYFYFCSACEGMSKACLLSPPPIPLPNPFCHQYNLRFYKKKVITLYFCSASEWMSEACLFFIVTARKAENKRLPWMCLKYLFMSYAYCNFWSNTIKNLLRHGHPWIKTRLGFLSAETTDDDTCTTNFTQTCQPSLALFTKMDVV